MSEQLMTFEDSVKARLKGIVAELIPEERWDGLVKKAVEEFEKKDLPLLVKDELVARYKKAIQEEFAKPEWQATWDGAGPSASPKLKAMLVEVAPLILAAMIGGSMQTVMSNLQYQLQQFQNHR